MKVFDDITEFRKWRGKINSSIGFVPTMGYLHAGHISLVRRAKAENKHVVVSIFVNPAQFGPQEDFAAYPRDTERDKSLLKEEKVDAIFMPNGAEMYPEGCSTWIELGDIVRRLEGASRPDHFRGVATIVAKLFNIVAPTRAYFGQKDAQQLVVIRKMAADLDMGAEIVTVPTMREHDGLAMSSRNVYLDPDTRESAVVIYQALITALKLYEKGERNASPLRAAMASLIENEPAAAIDYISIANSDTLEELTYIDHPALVSMAVKIGKTRLIDNRTIG